MHPHCAGGSHPTPSRPSRPQTPHPTPYPSNIVGAHRPEKADDYTALQPPGTRWLKGQSARGFDATATEHAVVMYRVDES